MTLRTPRFTMTLPTFAELKTGYEVHKALKSIQKHVSALGKRSRAFEHDSRLFELGPEELLWREKAETLLAHGYRLRARYFVGWTPSWAGRDVHPYFCEDSLRVWHRFTIDAVRAADGGRVIIKRVKAPNTEVEMSRYLSHAERRADPRNHCVHVLDYFRDDSAGPAVEFLVMPVLRQFDDPQFYRVSEVLECMAQIFEGVAYLHERRIAHLDIDEFTLMIDATPLYPRGFHPAFRLLEPSLRDEAKPLRRSEVRQKIQYFLTGFSAAKTFEVDEEVHPSKLGMGVSAPEASWAGVTCDPFAVDVYCVGYVFNGRLLQHHKSRLDFLTPLIAQMMAQKPSKRPRIESARETFEKLISQLGRSCKDKKLVCGVGRY